MAAIVVAVFLLTTAQVKAKRGPRVDDTHLGEELEPPLAE
jgi:hypothetical protein